MLIFALSDLFIDRYICRHVDNFKFATKLTRYVYVWLLSYSLNKKL